MCGTSYSRRSEALELDIAQIAIATPTAPNRESEVIMQGS